MAAEPERIGDASDDVEDMEDEEETTGDLKQQILKRPDILAALQDSTVNIMLTLPPPIKRRVKALKKLQLEATHIEAKFFEEVHELECKYHLLYTPLYEKRSTVVQGLYEPNDEECEFPSDDEKEDELSGDLKNKVKIEDVSETKEPATEEEKNNANAKGVPNFWLTIFKNVAILADMVHEHDEPILKHLIDVKVIFLKSDPMGFVLEFHFSPNDYFSNSVLTKVYEMKCVPEESDPFSFEGPEIYKCKGCTIDWKKNKNVTIKTIKKKQKHKSRGSVRTITKTVQNDSFFNFFAPPIMPEDPDAEVDEDTQSLLTTDFEIGHYIRERIVPRAVLYFTGLRAEICVCQPVDLCSTPSSNDGAVNLDIRIVTPAAGSECEPGAVYCCFSGPPDCGLRNNNLTNPTHLAPGQAKFGEFPWHALIVNLDNDYVGGGVIIDAHRIITAAHKISSLDKSQLVVRVGDWDVQSENELYPHLDTRVTSVSVHPQYNVETLGYDVAILTLSQRLRLYPEVPHINSICLPSTAMNFTSKRCWVSGWGKDMFGAGGSYQSIQKAVDVTVLSGNQCEQQLRQTRLGRSYTLDQHSFLCAGGEKDKDACTGDGGSPLVCEGEDGRWWLAGLVAWGVGCALPRVPGVYVNLANMVPWIQQHILPAVHHLVYLH